MANIKNYMTEITMVIVVFFALLFVTTNNNTALGTTYLQFLFGSVVLLFITILIFDKRVDVTVKKNNTSWIEEAMYGVGGWVVLLTFSFLVLKLVDPLKANLGAIMSSLNAANPIFSNSVFINFIVIALLIPFTETVVWGRAIEFFGDLLHIKISESTKNTAKFVVLLIVFSVIFALFHSTAKNLVGSALFIVFIMMAISIYLIGMRDGDMRAAIILHVLANGVAAFLIIRGSIVTASFLPLLVGVAT